MQITCQRVRLLPTRTASWLYVDGLHFGHIVEDAVREVVGEPVESWKIRGETAIPAGAYRVTLEHSGRFGPDTITLNDVPGYKYIRVHGGNHEGNTEGCPLVGFRLAPDSTILGGTSKPALAALKLRVKAALEAGEEVSWTTLNPTGYERPA